MKQLLLAAFLFVFTTNIQAQTPKVDTVVTEQWNGIDAWENEGRTIFTYDANCRLASILFQQWDDASQTWQNGILTTNTYASGDYISESLTQVWNDGTSSWDDFTRVTNTYDGSFKILTIQTEIWFVNAWQVSSLTTYKYDNNGYPDSVLTQTALIGPLQNAALSIYTNNPDGTPSQIVNQVWVVAAWQNSTRDTYTYNVDKTVSQTVIENWNIATSAWENSNRFTYTYASGRLASVLSEVWQTNAWVNESQTTYTYDGTGYLINSLNQSWNGSAWENVEQTNYTNNSDGTVYQAVSQNWDAGTSTWINETRSTYSYDATCTLPLKLLVFTAGRNNNVVTLSWQTAEEINTSHFTVQRSLDGTNFSSLGNVTAKNTSQTNYYGFTDNIEKVTGDKVYYRLQMTDKDGKFTYSKIIPLTLELYAGKIKTYPNPVKDELYILFNMQNVSRAELRITDATGKTVRSQRVDASLNNSAVGINVSSLGKGVYYVQLITDKNIQTTKFVKE
jgi:hypothetical protein